MPPPRQGGYQYRLCPLEEPLTEACFRRTPLPFDRSRQALLWNNGTRLPIGDKSVWVDEGVDPPGSTWAMNPIPRLGEASEGCLPVGSQCLSFEPPCPSDCTGAAGCDHPAQTTDPGTQQGECSGDWTGGQIVDTVLIPADLPPGQYVLSCECLCAT